MNKPTRPTYTAEFKLEAAQLVIDQGYTTQEAAKNIKAVGQTLERLLAGEGVLSEAPGW